MRFDSICEGFLGAHEKPNKPVKDWEALSGYESFAVKVGKPGEMSNYGHWYRAVARGEGAFVLSSRMDGRVETDMTAYDDAVNDNLEVGGKVTLQPVSWDARFEAREVTVRKIDASEQGEVTVEFDAQEVEQP